MNILPIVLTVTIIHTTESQPLSFKQYDDTELDTCHRIWQQDMANCNIKNSIILLAITINICICPRDKNQLVVRIT